MSLKRVYYLELLTFLSVGFLSLLFFLLISHFPSKSTLLLSLQLLLLPLFYSLGHLLVKQELEDFYLKKIASLESRLSSLYENYYKEKKLNLYLWMLKTEKNMRDFEEK